MGKFDGVLLASDYDNTLVYTERALLSGGEPPRLSEMNRAALTYFMENGGRFTVSTGRALPSFEQLAPDVPMAVGHSFASHKSLFSVVFFFVFVFGLQFLGLTSVFSFDGFNFGGVAAVHAFMGMMIAMSLVVCVIFYIITVLVLQKRLNLE